MPFSFRSALLLAAFAAGALRAEISDYPLALNLPTGDRMQFWDFGVVFAHRFDEPAPGHGKDLYGLDGYAYPGFGFDFGIKPVKGLNLIIYRTADNKTLTLGFTQRLLDADWLRLTLKAERFDEVVPQVATPLGTVGISGTAVQVPAELFLGDSWIITLDPAYISRTTTQPKAVFNAGLGLRFEATGKFSLLTEYYPRPGKIDKSYRPGFAAGASYKTFKHRFTVLATNALGTTTNEILSGDFGGGPRSTGQWALGFNISRTF